MMNEQGPFHSSGKLWEKLKPAALDMRHSPTPAEDVLWQRLRKRQIAGAKFRRQHAIDRFIVDFVCLKSHLVIEVDGPIHEQQSQADKERDALLTAKGFHVLRFRNEQVLTDIDAVLTRITEALEQGDQPEHS